MANDKQATASGKSPALKILLGIVALIVVLALVFMAIGRTSQPAVNTQIDKNPLKQENRNTVIGKLVEDGFFQKVELEGGSPRVTVGPAFLSLDLGTQTRLVRVVYAYRFDGSNADDTVLLVNADGTAAGSYSLATGLALAAGQPPTR